MGNHDGSRGGNPLHAGDGEVRPDGQERPEGIRPPTLGYAVTPQELILQVDGHFTHYPINAEIAVSIAAALLKMASWAMRK
jgi:hypothetical protein